MAYREVKVYDRDFPSFDQIYSGDPAIHNNWPVEVWQREVRTGEFAVRYQHFQTRRPMAGDGSNLSNQSAEIARIFDSLAEAKGHSRELVMEHPVTVCVVFDDLGKKVTTIYDRKGVGKFAAGLWFGILVCSAVLAAIGMGFLWILGWIFTWLLPKGWILRSLTLFQWLIFATAGAIVGVAAWYAKFKISIDRQAQRNAEKIRGSFTPAERKHYEQLNSLHGSSDPAERERFLKISRELQQKVHQVLKKN